MDGTTALDSVLQQAHLAQVSSVSGFGVDGEIRDPDKQGRAERWLAPPRA